MPWGDATFLALIGTVFVSSVLGSVHCAGMCGGLMLFALGPRTERPRDPWLHAAYHGGRGITYTIAGAIAGAIGSAADLAGSSLGVQRATAVLAGLAIATIALVSLLRVGGVHLARFPIPKRYVDAIGRLHRFAADLPPRTRALWVGLLTVFLPCGWLYVFVLAAAGTGNPLYGALTMSVFWAGTLPLMVSLGVGLRMACGPLARRVPLWTTIALCLLGVVSVLARVRSPVTLESVESRSDASVIEVLQHTDPHDLPCCNPEPPPDPAPESESP